MNKISAKIFSDISDYVNTEPSWVLAVTYKIDKAQLVESHTSKATPQFGFHRGIKGVWE